ncbi:hypothetical protein D9M68_550450 [compost metagenome]
MRKFLFIPLILLLFSGCDRKCCMNISALALIKYVNQQGEDLLDPAHPNALIAEDIEVYVEKDGKRIRQYDGRLDAPKNFKIYKSDNDGYLFHFNFPINYNLADKNKMTVFITYKNNSEDKLVGEFNSLKGNNIVLQRVWINDADMGSPAGILSKAFKIVK